MPDTRHEAAIEELTERFADMLDEWERTKQMVGIRERAGRLARIAYEAARVGEGEPTPLQRLEALAASKGRTMEQVIADAERVERELRQEQVVVVCERCGHAQERAALAGQPEPRTSLLDEPSCKPYPTPRDPVGLAGQPEADGHARHWFIEGWVCAREDLYPKRPDVLQREAEEAWRMAWGDAGQPEANAELDDPDSPDHKSGITRHNVGQPEVEERPKAQVAVGLSRIGPHGPSRRVPKISDDRELEAVNEAYRVMCDETDLCDDFDAAQSMAMAAIQGHARVEAEQRPALPDDTTPQEERLALRLIATERERQVSDEGWTPEHDDEHREGELAAAAAAYAYSHALILDSTGRGVSRERMWPFSERFKGTDSPSTVMEGSRVRELVKAGALIVAEIERLHRAARTPQDVLDRDVEPEESSSLPDPKLRVDWGQPAPGSSNPMPPDQRAEYQRRIRDASKSGGGHAPEIFVSADAELLDSERPGGRCTSVFEGKRCGRNSGHGRSHTYFYQQGGETNWPTHLQDAERPQETER